MARTRPPRCRGEDGTAIIEAAIATPVVFLFLFGVLEFGSLFFSYETVTNGTTAIARTAAIMGSDATADYEIVQAAKKSLGGVNKNQIQKIVIWDASPGPAASPRACSTTTCKGPGSTVPTACLSASTPSERCNLYVPGTHWDNALTAAAFDCAPNPAPNYADAWCPTTRKTAQTGTSGPPDYLGIYIEYQHNWITGLFGNSITIKETKITKLEPTRLL